MVTPPVHYGDRVITVAEQFDKLERGLRRVEQRANLVALLIIIHLMGFDLNTVADLTKLIAFKF
jgi:hypothetical protein